MYLPNNNTINCNGDTKKGYNKYINNFVYNNNTKQLIPINTIDEPITVQQHVFSNLISKYITDSTIQSTKQYITSLFSENSKIIEDNPISEFHGIENIINEILGEHENSAFINTKKILEENTELLYQLQISQWERSQNNTISNKEKSIALQLAHNISSIISDHSKPDQFINSTETLNLLSKTILK